MEAKGVASGVLLTLTALFILPPLLLPSSRRGSGGGERFGEASLVRTVAGRARALVDEALGVPSGTSGSGSGMGKVGHGRKASVTVDIHPHVHKRECRLPEVPHIADTGVLPRPVANVNQREESNSKYSEEVSQQEVILATPIRRSRRARAAEELAFHRAGPRKEIAFSPGDVTAAVVTCGDLSCPGTNAVLAHIVMTLRNNYGVDRVIGFRYGFEGMLDKNEDLVDLTLDSVRNRSLSPGSLLGNSKGGFDCRRVLQRLQSLEINQFYIIGGMTALKNAAELTAEVRRQNLPIVVAVVPKTLDDAMALMDTPFGYSTATDEAVRILDAVTTDAHCARNGISIVKLMGQKSGFLAAGAVCASSQADLCLIPEVPFRLDGDDGVLAYVERHLRRHRHMVIVVADGAGADLLDAATPDIGLLLSKRIEAHLRRVQMPFSMVYHDPGPIITARPPNATDAQHAFLLGVNVVHGGMHGYTGFVCCLVSGRCVYIPLTTIMAMEPRRMNPKGRVWERVLSVTQQPAKMY